jgi:hypothetical protein
MYEMDLGQENLNLCLLHSTETEKSQYALDNRTKTTEVALGECGHCEFTLDSPKKSCQKRGLQIRTCLDIRVCLSDREDKCEM